MKAKPINRKGAPIRICEIYASRQGEGLLTGTVSVFVRTSGCNLRCWFCDTPFASWNPEGEQMSVESILERTLACEAAHVVITGGEPMIHAPLIQLCQMLHERGRHITIETAGTVYQALHCDLISISPKLASSTPKSASRAWTAAHQRRRERLEVVRHLMTEHAYQLKFVIDSPADAEEMLDYLDRLGTYQRERVLLMPQGTQFEQLERQAEWLVPWCESHAFRYCPRAHIQWYGNTRGT